MANISLRGIYKVYPGNVTAVDNFNLEIEDKEFVVFVGPSGCGKSTTLRMIAGLEDITRGELYIGETLVNHTPPKDRNIAMVFQNYALYPHMSVYKNMAFGLELRKTPKDVIRAKVTEAAKILDIERLLNRKPKELSGGQRQRVALGRAMVRNPDVFLLDEPLSNLDAKLRTQMRTEIAKLHKRLGTTFIYVTHDQIEAMTMADRIVVMRDGFIQQVDTPQNLYAHPANTFVAGFIGSPQMNFFEVTIEQQGQEFVAVFGRCRLPLPAEKLSAGLEKYIGKQVVMGLRPENITDAAAPVGGPLLGHIEATLEISEMMGSEYYLHLNSQDTKLVAKVPTTQNTQPGSKVELTLLMDKTHFFDKESQRTICN